MGGPSKGVASLRLLPRRLRVARLRLKEIALVLLAAMCAAVGNSHDSNQVSMISQRCNALFLSIPFRGIPHRRGTPGGTRSHQSLYAAVSRVTSWQAPSLAAARTTGECAIEIGVDNKSTSARQTPSARRRFR